VRVSHRIIEMDHTKGQEGTTQQDSEPISHDIIVTIFFFFLVGLL
jgi:hypothetical protein